LYCPLPLSLEPYWSCEPDCYHCSFRGLNSVWGNDLRPMNLEALDRRLNSGSKNKQPKSPIAFCLRNKKTVRIGSKSDPYQPIEKKLRLTSRCLRLFRKYNWSVAIQTRFTRNMISLSGSSILKANKRGLITLIPVISPGMEKDWELFERKRTTPIEERLEDIQTWVKAGVPVGVNGEPFIPGHHTPSDFENAIKRLKSVGCTRYNTYNFHFTPFVAKRIAGLPGVDIEKIWYMNQDKNWKPLLQKLLDISKKHGIILGCPDFVNTGPSWVERANTCCGVDVPNPSTFNTHYFKQLAQKGLSITDILEKTWDGSGDLEEGKAIISGTTHKMYTLKDAGVI
jgi:DNA repair photolyase